MDAEQSLASLLCIAAKISWSLREVRELPIKSAGLAFFKTLSCDEQESRYEEAMAAHAIAEALIDDR